jgi:chemotaxis protein methyltransferase CheR
MRDADCVAFLQWALPRLDLRWSGFRKVRSQVCKRIKRRMRDIGIKRFAAYRARLENDAEEWRVLDGLCNITISRFYRDRGVFDILRTDILPLIAARAVEENRPARCWSAGCASGEEPFTLKILWEFDIAPRFGGLGMEIVATDIDEIMLGRAEKGFYPRGSLRELPEEFVEAAFDAADDSLCLRPPYRQGVTFLRQDLRSEAPEGLFDLILCRNTAFTYFVPPLQQQVLDRFVARLGRPGWIVLGMHETLPEHGHDLAPLPHARAVFELR